MHKSRVTNEKIFNFETKIHDCDKTESLTHTKKPEGATENKTFSIFFILSSNSIHLMFVN